MSVYKDKNHAIIKVGDFLNAGVNSGVVSLGDPLHTTLQILINTDHGFMLLEDLLVNETHLVCAEIIRVGDRVGIVQQAPLIDSTVTLENNIHTVGTATLQELCVKFGIETISVVEDAPIKSICFVESCNNHLQGSTGVCQQHLNPSPHPLLQPIVNVGEELTCDVIGECIVIAVSHGRAWVSHPLAQGASFESIVDAADLKPRKTPDEIEFERLVAEANSVVENDDSGDIGVIEILIKAGYRHVTKS